MLNQTAQEKIGQFQQRLLAFGRMHGRDELPWRQTRNPWQLLMAEILLRKTTSRQAQEVYNRMKDFTANDIVQMPLAALEALLQPIGLYKVRAAGLKAVAERLTDMPLEALQSDEFLRSLPGVGRYISNAVRCCAFDEPVPALDTNMIRVVQRVFGWKSERKRAREDSALWAFAGTLVPIEDARAFNWAVLDFGAAICTGRQPKCNHCLLSSICTYFQQRQCAADSGT
jgi:A/G-specific adenine glycosylase